MFVFFFNDTATTEIYTLSLHDALPICTCSCSTATWERRPPIRRLACSARWSARRSQPRITRSEEHTSELQSRSDLVCRLLLEKKTNQASEQRYTAHTATTPHGRGITAT